jgi:hypothetical protein
VRSDEIDDDPRQGRKPAPTRKGRNTESFDPASTLARPDLRIRVGSARGRYDLPLRHDDVIFVPGFFGAEDDWRTYHALIAEVREAHAQMQRNGDRGEQADWMPWHEGCHLISRAVSGCPTFTKVTRPSLLLPPLAHWPPHAARSTLVYSHTPLRAGPTTPRRARTAIPHPHPQVLHAMADYFGVEPSAKATRFNWYKDASDWKPLHHDSAAFNPQRARSQNLTIGISFGAERELAFLHARTGARIALPCPNGSLYAFGRDVNMYCARGTIAREARTRAACARRAGSRS